MAGQFIFPYPGRIVRKKKMALHADKSGEGK
jgi:hypothetical protein